MKNRFVSKAVPKAAVFSAAVSLVVLLVLLSSCGASPGGRVVMAEPGELFSSGDYGFVMSYEATPDAAKLALEIVERDGKKALLAASSGGTPYLAIDAASLLGENAPKARVVEIVVGAEHAGEFYAVSGVLSSLTGPGLEKTDYPWSVYLQSKNPNAARAELTKDADRYIAGEYGILILSKDIDNAAADGAAPADLCIYDIRFLDENGDLLPLNAAAGFNAPDGFGITDTSNLAGTKGDAVIDGAAGESGGGWGQAAELPTIKNEGNFDPALLAPGNIVTVYYKSENPPNLILQSWTDGAPESAGWAQVEPAFINDSRTTAQYRVSDIIEAFGTDDFETFLDTLYVGDTDAALTVYSVTIGAEIGGEAK
ncbi:MAG: hypothetical protein LBS85_06205 [Clostridiales Family XIII bacterium]|jgi:hypothetical protein|nr:hypothetical protein [Clostridiales Family XIII bacterium]